MRVSRVYVDTSVIGGCFDPEFSAWSNGLVEDFRRGSLVPVLSEVVASEVQPAPENVRSRYSEILALSKEFLQVTKESLELLAAYGEQGILPPRFRNDMLHIALATVSDVDVLVSWNFKHIVRLDKIRVFNSINLALGYRQLQIYSPREVTSYGKE